MANQSVAAGTSVDPGATITLQVYHAPETTTLPNEAPAEGDASNSDTGSWTCNVKLDQPSTYTGGPVQLTLVQQKISAFSVFVSGWKNYTAKQPGNLQHFIEKQKMFISGLELQI